MLLGARRIYVMCIWCLVLMTCRSYLIGILFHEAHYKNVNYYCLLRTDDLADMAAIPVPGL
ncbi:hypothetical protein M405DRAFT_53705 [Rhizopogon salebrosus TDB-379]|nr:hypothetical protein M405DRAFT_53705 [Rhizopogon salebrosus TDB-379]